MKTSQASWRTWMGALTLLAGGALAAASAEAAVPGISSTTGAAGTFNLQASEGSSSQPDGTSMYSWGYGCAALSTPSFLPANWQSPTSTGAPPGVPTTGIGYSTASNAAAKPTCGAMQLPGPTLIVPEGTAVTVNLTNNLPVAAGNTSIIFAGQSVTASGGSPGTLIQEAGHGATVTYKFTAGKPGTYAYYSGTQGDVQVDMGLYGALIVLPSAATATAANAAGNHCVQGPYSLAAAAYDNIWTCYDREYLFQISEASLSLHQAVLDQVTACRNAATASCAPVQAASEPYRPDFFMINGRSLPDDLDPPYLGSVPNQPYNGNPHMHPGENILVRIIGQGRIQHPFHIHGNHERVIARDGNLVLAAADAVQAASGSTTDTTLTARLSGPVLFTISTVSGQSIDGIFNWTGKGLNWDVYGHNHAGTPVGATVAANPSADTTVCYADANGFYTSASSPAAPLSAPNYGEWCADHNKAIPVTPPDPIVVANGQWYGGTPYLGIQGGTQNPLPPTGSVLNSAAGYAYMWHSHDEREITTRNVFPGGLMTMLIIDPPSAPIDETQ